MMKLIDAIALAAALSCGFAAAGTIQDRGTKLWEHEQAYKGSLTDLTDSRVFMDRILATLEVCELDAGSSPPINFDKWYAARVGDLKGAGALRLRSLSQDPKNPDRAEATSLLRRVQALSSTLVVNENGSDGGHSGGGSTKGGKSAGKVADAAQAPYVGTRGAGSSGKTRSAADRAR
jgi:hypothetical protein